MKRNHSSLTAAGIAIVRAIESEKPAGERICYDPYARRFVSSGLFYFVKFFARLGYADWKGPGVWEFLAARERFIDNHLESCLGEGLAQLVILGAGYDARAYRFEALKAGVRVFEVDHPATQAVKLKKLTAIFGAPPPHVTYVAIDFDRENLADRLFASGYDEQRKTLFIWQGVTQYLTPVAVDGTLAFVAGHSAPGNRVIFDYMDATLLSGPPRRGEIRNMRRYRRLSGEGLVFGIPMASIQAFLEERGFTQVHNADHVALEKVYFRAGSRQRRVADGYAIVTAVVGRGENAHRGIQV
ncbi:MAG: SAM-dependent methyltransferase [Nitrososphaerales archaeon]